MKFSDPPAAGRPPDVDLSFLSKAFAAGEKNISDDQVNHLLLPVLALIRSGAFDWTG